MELSISTIESGIAFIRKYCDKNADCSPGTDFGQMLCEYVLRAESGDLETFKKDYSEEIVGAKIEADVKAAEKKFAAQIAELEKQK